MPLKKCLLVSDDPDDHQAVTDLLEEYYPDTIALIVLNSQKAIELLTEKSISVDFLMLDLGMQGIRINSLLSTLEADVDLKNIPVALYGDEDDATYVSPKGRALFFNKDYTYAELKMFLDRFFRSTSAQEK